MPAGLAPRQPGGTGPCTRASLGKGPRAHVESQLATRDGDRVESRRRGPHERANAASSHSRAPRRSLTSCPPRMRTRCRSSCPDHQRDRVEDGAFASSACTRQGACSSVVPSTRPRNAMPRPMRDDRSQARRPSRRQLAVSASMTRWRSVGSQAGSALPGSSVSSKRRPRCFGVSTT